MKKKMTLQRVAFECGDFARQLSYHRALAKYKGRFVLNFWIIMFNNAIELSILDWIHLFGSHKDDLHWKNNVKNSNSFRESLLNMLKIDEQEWESYRSEVKEYRDKDIAHIEVREKSHVPEMELALEATNYYYKYAFKELSGYLGNNKLPLDLIDYYKKSLEQTQNIVDCAFNSTQVIKENVR